MLSSTPPILAAFSSVASFSLSSPTASQSETEGRRVWMEEESRERRMEGKREMENEPTPTPFPPMLSSSPCLPGNFPVRKFPLFFAPETLRLKQHSQASPIYCTRFVRNMKKALLLE